MNCLLCRQFTWNAKSYLLWKVIKNKFRMLCATTLLNASWVNPKGPYSYMQMAESIPPGLLKSGLITWQITRTRRIIDSQKSMFLSHVYMALQSDQNQYLIFNPFSWSGLFYHKSLDQSISNSRVSVKFFLLLYFIAIAVVNAVLTLIRCHILQCLTWVCTVC